MAGTGQSVVAATCARAARASADTGEVPLLPQDGQRMAPVCGWPNRVHPVRGQEGEALMLRLFSDPGPQATASVPAQTSIGATAARILAPNAKRKGVFIQNTGLTVLKLVFGSSDPTQTVYHVALGASTGADDGTGGAWSDDAWIGEIRAISSAPGGTFVLAEFTTGSPDWNRAGDLGVTG